MNRRKFIQTCSIAPAAFLPGSSHLESNHTANVFPVDTYSGSGYIKPFVGTWFEFEHHNQVGAKYWNPALVKFTKEQWKAMIKEMHEIGMEYLVMLAVAYNGKTYYPSAIQPRHDCVCEDPLEAVLEAADECGAKFFISNDYWSDWQQVEQAMTNEAIWRLREKGMEEVVKKYGHHKSFYGWYYPNESGLNQNIDEITISYVNRCSKMAKALTPKALTMIAPYGTKSIIADDRYVRQLERLDIDIVAYQDEVRVEKTEAGAAGKYYENLYKAHVKAGRARLWADLEIFRFEGEVYTSPALPATFERVLKQLEDISPFVENVLIYQYPGLMNKPGTQAFAGHKESEKLYTDYVNWLNSRRKL